MRTCSVRSTALSGRRLVALVAACITAVTLSGCGGSSGASGAQASKTYSTTEPLKMTVGVQSLVLQTYYPQLAQALGYFKDENLSVSIVQGEATANSVQGLIGGSIDAYLGGPEGVAANEQGANLRFMAGAANRSIWDIVTPPGISSLKQLEGKVVAVSAVNSISTTTLRQALKANGVDPAKLQYVTAGGTGKRFAALKAGQAQAAPLGLPVNYQATDTEHFKDFGNTNSIGAPPLAAAVLTVNKTWADSHHNTMIRFLRAYQRVVDALYNPAMKERITGILAAGLKVDPKYAARGLNELFFDAKTAGTSMPKDSHIDPAALTTAINAFVEFGALKKKAEPSSVIDETLLHEAQQSLMQSPPK